MTHTVKTSLAVIVVLAASLAVWQAVVSHRASHSSASSRQPMVPITSTATAAAGDAVLARDAIAPALSGDPSKHVDPERLVFDGQLELTGRVVDEGGDPVTGASVRIVPLLKDHVIDGVAHGERDEYRALGFADTPVRAPVRSARTDDEGEYQLARVRGHFQFMMQVAADEYLGATWWPAVGNGYYEGFPEWTAQRLPDIVLRRGHGLIVRVQDERGAPVAGARVFSNFAGIRPGAGRSQAIQFPPSYWDDRGTSGRDGELAFTPQETGPQWVLACDDAGRQGLVPRTDWNPDAPRLTVDVTLMSAPTFSAHVESASGQSLPGVRVNLRYLEPGTDVQMYRQASTDDRGTAVFGHVPEVAKRLHADASGGMPDVIVSDPKKSFEEECTVVAPQDHEGTIAVQLAGPMFPVRFVDLLTGEPVRAAVLLVVQDDLAIVQHGVPTRGMGILAEDHTHGWAFLARRERKANFTDEQSARFALIADADGHAPTRFGPFDPDSLSDTEPLVLALERGAFVAGRVLTPDGEPAAGARIAVHGPGEGRSFSSFTKCDLVPVRAAVADENGSFRIGPLAKGSHELVATSAPFLETRLPVDVGDRDLKGVVITAQRGGSIEGCVSLGESELPGRFLVAALDRGTHRLATVGLSDNGCFALGPLLPAAYAVIAAPVNLVDPTAAVVTSWTSSNQLLSEVRALLENPTQCTSITVAASAVHVDLEPWRPAIIEQITMRGQLVLSSPKMKRSIEVSLPAVNSGFRSRSATLSGDVFEVTLPKHDRYWLLVKEPYGDDSGGEWYVTGRVVTLAEALIGAVRIEVQRTRLSFALTRRDGAPFASASRVLLSLSLDGPGEFQNPNYSPPWWYNNRSVAIPADGQIVIEDLPAGDYDISFSWPGAWHQLPGRRHLPPGETTVINLELPPTR